MLAAIRRFPPQSGTSDGTVIETTAKLLRMEKLVADLDTQLKETSTRETC